MTMKLSDNLIHDAFVETGIDQKYYSLYETEIKRHYKVFMEICLEDDESAEEDCAQKSIDITNKYIVYYVAEIEKGHNHQWAHEYAQLVYYHSESFAVNSAYESLPEEEREKELEIYAKSIDKSPIFVNRFMSLFKMREPDAKENALIYSDAYHTCISNGKSEIYARAYADAASEDYYIKFCEIYAVAYECAINHGMDDGSASLFGYDCIKAAGRDCLVEIFFFKGKYKEEWQREFYLKLTKQEFEEEKKRPITESEFKGLRDSIFGK